MTVGVRVAETCCVAVIVGVPIGVAVVAIVAEGELLVGSKVPGASGGSVAAFEAPVGVGVVGPGAVLELANVQANEMNDNATKQRKR